MEDNQIVELFWARAEQAIAELAAKYGRLCRGIAYRILDSRPDAEECESDTYLRVWNTVPPEKPVRLCEPHCAQSGSGSPPVQNTPEAFGAV